VVSGADLSPPVPELDADCSEAVGSVKPARGSSVAPVRKHESRPIHAERVGWITLSHPNHGVGFAWEYGEYSPRDLAARVCSEAHRMRTD